MFTRLLKEESGQAMVEYGLLVAFIAILVLAVLVTLGPKIAGFFTTVETALTPPPATTP
jgi:pilus assembly protein Flp/PilA